MKNLIKEVEKKIRQVCTYYSEFDEGTAGYDLSEEQFQKLFSLIFQEYTEKIVEEIREEVKKMEREGGELTPYLEVVKTKNMDKMFDYAFEKARKDILSILSQ